MYQELSDHLDQMDLALDQIALCDRNYDRFSMMLIDNVVELTLHQYAQDKNRESEMWAHMQQPEFDKKALTKALGPRFDAKVKFAKDSGLIESIVAESIQYLHGYRNTAYHRGLRHDSILHSLALLYFKLACDLLTNYKPGWWSFGSSDKISHRAVKYLGPSRDMFSNAGAAFANAWGRMKSVAESMGNALVMDLRADLEGTISEIDEAISFIVENADRSLTREQVVADCQIWELMFSDEGISFAKENGFSWTNSLELHDWLSEHYPGITKSDPIPSWNSRLLGLGAEKDDLAALKKYCDFLLQTEKLRSSIMEAAHQLDAHIQHQIDVIRGK